jgi:hypothetical protein
MVRGQAWHHPSLPFRPDWVQITRREFIQAPGFRLSRGTLDSSIVRLRRKQTAEDEDDDDDEDDSRAQRTAICRVLRAMPFSRFPIGDSLPRKTPTLTQGELSAYSRLTQHPPRIDLWPSQAMFRNRTEYTKECSFAR